MPIRMSYFSDYDVMIVDCFYYAGIVQPLHSTAAIGAGCSTLHGVCCLPSIALDGLLLHFLLGLKHAKYNYLP